MRVGLRGGAQRMAGHCVKQTRKIMTDNAFGESILLIGHDAQFYACAVQRGKQGGDAGIRSRRQRAVKIEYHSSVQKDQLLSRMRIKRGAVPAQRRKSTVTPLTA